MAASGADARQIASLRIAVPDIPRIKGPPSSGKASSLPMATVDYLKAWIMHPDHIAHPYPTDKEKEAIM